MPAPATHPLVRRFLRQSTWSDTTKQSCVTVANRWCRWLADHELDLVTVTQDDCDDYLAERKAAVSMSTAQIDWRMMRAVYRWLADEGEIAPNPMGKIKFGTPPEGAVKVITEAEYRKLVATCDRRFTHGRRDEAMLTLLWWSGLRRGEVVNVDLSGLDLDRRVLTVGSAKFGTKTGKVRRVPLAAETVAAIDRYLSKRGEEPGPLFLSERGDDHDDRRLRPNSLQLMIRRRAYAAGLGRSVGAHEFRRAMATRHKRVGGSDPALMAIAGWSSIRMIDRYTRMEREDLAAEEFHRLIDTSKASTRRRGRRVS